MPHSISLSTVLIVFAAALVLSTLFLRDLDKIGWKWLDMATLILAFFGLVSATFDFHEQLVGRCCRPLKGAKMKTFRLIVLAISMALTGLVQAQSTKSSGTHLSDKERLIGAWHLAHIDSPGPDGKSLDMPQPIGMLIYTRDGHISVQLMYPKSPSAQSNEYVLDGYEASFGSYDVDESTHTLTHHVQASNTRDLLVGKDLPRSYQFTQDGHLIIKPTRPNEHWSVTWEHY